MKCLVMFFLANLAVDGQTGTAGVQGNLTDAKTLKPVPAAWVILNRVGTPPLSRHTKSGGDGSFQLSGLEPGSYSICVQAAGDRYLDPCQWSGAPTVVTLTSGQTNTGVSVKLNAASVLSVQVQDKQNVLSQLTKDGRRPDLTLGIWGPKGLYYPAHSVGGTSPVARFPTTITTYSYQLAVPLDTSLNLFIASRDLKLGDSTGVALLGNVSQQSFQHLTGDVTPKSFAFTVLGLLP